MLTNMFKEENLIKYKSVVEKITNKIKNHDGLIRIITHNDADGLTSGAIIIKLLTRQNKKFHLSIVEQLSEDFINELGKENTINNIISKNESKGSDDHNNSNSVLYIFSDMGSGQINKILENNLNSIILDHHPTEINDIEIENILQLNPHIFKIDGSNEISASGVCYLVAREFGYYDLSVLAITGAIGDMQHLPFIGLNKFILNEGMEKQHINGILRDIIYNCYDISITDSILFSFNPYIKELKKREQIINLLNKYNIDPNKIYLDGEDKKNLEKALSSINPNYINELYVDRYIINHNEKDGHYLMELLNACGKNGNAQLGICTALGDENCIKEAKKLNYEYKLNIVEALNKLKLNHKDNFDYFFGEKGTTGLLAGLLAKDRPIMGINKDENYYKISSRGNHNLVSNGLNLTEVMKLTELFGGSGGGHSVASGGKIPIESLEEFLDWADDLIGEQLKNNM
ncbi:phosphoesterase RecJ domain protein [Methanococcus aeolicus Nankai-3]|uniref:Phosphoesterase RecJ domain protein n=1 Tax=Methanococcus aeolicus (strain ATCC BAA-1280 / DSM 17508 / OCM 812 / Nankai-3) TaxID=419665 RepID=A6UTA9_META3|nr:DHH family phosphoesterase [Methanococcus aeolicus]ABR55731.1 phosphoesterase RecJ domain protein [Methanococcus aeolicus Nankai-3]